MRVRAAVSCEYDLKPVQTVRLEFESADLAAACKTAVFQAEKQYPRANPRSMVTCVEILPDPVGA